MKDLDEDLYHEILRLSREGNSYREIGKILGVSYREVGYIVKLYNKIRRWEGDLYEVRREAERVIKDAKEWGEASVGFRHIAEDQKKEHDELRERSKRLESNIQSRSFYLNYLRERIKEKESEEEEKRICLFSLAEHIEIRNKRMEELEVSIKEKEDRKESLEEACRWLEDKFRELSARMEEEIVRCFSGLPGDARLKLLYSLQKDELTELMNELVIKRHLPFLRYLDYKYPKLDLSQYSNIDR